MNKKTRAIFISFTLSAVIAGCSSGPDSDALFKDWLNSKMPDRWSLGQYTHQGSEILITASMEAPYDQDYVGTPAWRMQSFARTFCPSLSEIQRMGLNVKAIQVQTKGSKVGNFAQVNCPTGYVEDK